MATEEQKKSNEKREIEQTIDLTHVHFKMVLMGKIDGGIVILEPEQYVRYRANKSLKNAISALKWRLKWKRS